MIVFRFSFALSDGKERNIEANSTVNIDRDDDTGFDNETLCDNDTEDAYRTPTMETSNKFRRDIEHLSSQNL